MMRPVRSLTAAGAAGLLLACGESAPPPPMAERDRPVPVQVVTVARQEVAPPVVATGFIAARDEVALAFKVPGVIASLPVESGLRVEAGALLATLVPTEVEAVVAKADQGVNRARREVERTRRLAADSVLPRVLRDDAETMLALAQADQRMARFNAEQAEIRAPRRGVVLRRLSAPGGLVGPGVPVVLFRPDGDGVLLRAGLSDRDAARVRPGDRATVRFDALPDQSFTGRLQRVAAMANPANGTFDADIALNAAATRLASGLVGFARVVPTRQAPSVAIPLAALVEADGDSAQVFVVAGEAPVARARRIRIGPPESDLVAVLGGLEAGERVIVAGAAFVTDGGRVQLAPTPAPAGASAGLRTP